MITDNTDRFDFSSCEISQLELFKASGQWIEKFARLFVHRWSDFSKGEIAVTPRKTFKQRFDELQSSWSQPQLGLSLKFGEAKIPAVLVAPRKEMLGILLGILGDDSSDELQDREMTTIEASLCQLIFEHLAMSLGEAWPQKETPTVEVEQMVPTPRQTRLFEPLVELLIAGFTLQPEGRQLAHCQFLVPKAELEQLFGIDSSSFGNSANVDSRKLTEETISQVQVTLSAVLGNTTLEMPQLLGMHPGDIIKLDQAVTQPIQLFVNDQPVFLAWPGRVGKQQSLKVHSITT